MAFPSKTQMPIASNKRTQLDLSCQHITTSEFMQINIAKCMEIVPNQSVNIQMETFARLASMPVPTFGRANIKSRAYFVPFRTVFPLFNDFITDVPSVSGVGGEGGSLAQISSVPVINNQSFSGLFRDYSDISTQVASENVAHDYVYTVYDTNGNVTGKSYRVFTPFGRHIYKILRSLGYNPDFTTNRHYVSALPLLSYCRIFLDFYYPSQYANDEDSAWLTSLLRSDYTVSTQYNMFSTAVIYRMFGIITKLTYETDYFTSAWDNANAPNSQLGSQIEISDINQTTTTTADVSPAAQFNPTNNPNAPYTTSSSISQFTLSALRSLSDYMRRHQISGSRVLDRYLSRFGVQLKPEKLNRCVFIGEHLQEIQFADVTSTSDTANAEGTSGASLGQFAGKGISYGSGGFDFTSDEYGMLIIISIITPVTQYYQGEDRMVRHLTKLDFFTPEFDALGTQALGATEVYVPIDGSAYKGYHEKVFGFVPRYAEYKVAKSQITGDYLLGSMNVGQREAWTLFRNLDSYVNSLENGVQDLKHDINFVRATDATQYNRIFNTTSDVSDHINVIHNFRINSSFPGSSLFDTYEFDDEDKSQKVTIDVNGNTHN